jgi:hypothetical protein
MKTRGLSKMAFVEYSSYINMLLFHNCHAKVSIEANIISTVQTGDAIRIVL